MARMPHSSGTQNQGLQKIAEDIAAVRVEREFNAEQLHHIEEGVDVIIKRLSTQDPLDTATSSAMLQALTRIGGQLESIPRSVSDTEALSHIEERLEQIFSIVGMIRNDRITEISGIRTEIVNVRDDIKDIRNIAVGGRADVHRDLQQIVSHLAKWCVALMSVVIICTVILLFFRLG